MIDKLDIYNKINSKNYLRFDLNESNEKEYLNKLISVRDALIVVERKNNEAFETKINKLVNFKEEVKAFYNYLKEIEEAKDNLLNDFNSYVERYINPLNELIVRKEKLQVQMVPYITDGFWKKFKAIFSYEGRAKLTIEKQFNKELKSINKEIKDLNFDKEKNPLNFSNREEDTYKKIIENIDLDLVNKNLSLSESQKKEFILSLNLSKNSVIKKYRVDLLNKVSEYIEVCSDYVQIEDLNVEEHYKFKNTEYKLYFQEGYLDNDYNSILKYLEMSQSENDFVGKQAANKLVDGIQECIDELGSIIQESDDDSLKLA